MPKQQEQPVSTVLFISGYSCTNNETAGKKKVLKKQTDYGITVVAATGQPEGDRCGQK